MNPQTSTPSAGADLILMNGRITTLDRQRPSASSVAVKDGRFVAVGSDADAMAHRGQTTTIVDLRGRAVIPGLNDSHLHVIRGGLNYMMELRWDGVPSLTDALRMLREQAQRTPAPQWLRVVGGFTESQFVERRLPTLEELNDAAPDTPVFVLHLYDRALLNRAALRAAGYTKDTPDPTGGHIERDKAGNPTGLLIARPNALILYSTLAKGPKLSRDHQRLSTRYFMRELNRLGVTSAIDAGGGFQNYPDDYEVVSELRRADELTMRIAYNLFTQRPRQEVEDFAAWVKMTRPGDGDDVYRMNGAGEMLVFSAADFEDFREPRPEIPPTMESELEQPTAGTRSNAGATRPRLVCDQLPTVERIRVGEARQRVASGQALLICAYDDEERYRKFNLEGAIWLVDLQTRLTSLSKDHELIFYCA